MTRHTRRYNERRALGLCGHCGNTPARSNRTTCQECAEYLQAQSKRRYKDARAKGICTYCHEQQAVLGKADCLACLNLRNDARTKVREFVYAAYGNKCSCLSCGETKWQFLTLDHVGDDGAAHRKEINCVDIIDWAKKNNCPPTLRLLCWNCNGGRERNNGVCPHLTDLNASNPC